MAQDAHSYARATPGEIVAEFTQKAPETQRDEAKQLHDSLEKQWEPQKARYEGARWLAQWLLYTFLFVIVWSGIMILTLLILGTITATRANVGETQINLVTGFIKDLLPYIATPLGVALGFYFRGTQG